MQNPFQPNLRKPWLLLCTTLLVVYTILPDSRETLFFLEGTSSLLEAAMFLLSFPLGDLAAFFFFYSDGHGVFARFAFWALAMGLGYAQWFHLFPALLSAANRAAAAPAQPLTVLNLESASSVAPARARSAPSIAPPAADVAERPPVPQFDERGRTPLERVLRDDS